MLRDKHGALILSKTLALYKSFTYLLTYLLTWHSMIANSRTGHGN